MGVCLQFGPRISEDCDHPMEAGAQSCACPGCGAVCPGRFGGCREVWANRAVPLAFVARPVVANAGSAEQSVAAPAGRPPQVSPPARPADYEQLRAELVQAVSAAVDALGCRLEQEQQAQWLALREEIDKRLADLLIVSGEPGTAGASNGSQHQIEPQTQGPRDSRVDP